MAAITVDLGFPAGPWVLVLGMHRSGTSAVTGALGRLGLALPAAGDLVAGRYDNPVHYESRALTDIDDALLRVLGGTWSAPPVLKPGWVRTPEMLGLAGAASSAARRAFPGVGPVAWKDPRLCLLLPLWRSWLPPPVATIWLWRAPLSVARSLRARQGFTVSLGLALWERYTRATLAALGGHEVYVLRYEELLDDPSTVVRSLARWLCGTGHLSSAPDDAAVALAASSVSGSLARHVGDGEVPDVVRRAVTTLGTLGGPVERLPEVTLPEPPPWMADAIEQRREYEALYARYLRYVKWRRRIPFMGGSGRRTRRSRGNGGAP